jgi:spore coat protein U-like protein
VYPGACISMRVSALSRLVVLCIVCLGMTGVHPPCAAGASMSAGGGASSASVSVTLSTLSFGDIGEPGTYGGTASLDVTVPPGMEYAVAADAGLHSFGGFRCVMLKDGAEVIPYQLYKDPACNTPWGDSDFEDTFPYGSAIRGEGTGAPQSVTMYGRLLVGPAPIPGLYGDSVVITLHF